jgi:hypothetical protein
MSPGSTVELSAVKFGGSRTVGSAMSNSEIGHLKRASSTPFGLNDARGPRDIGKGNRLLAFMLRFGS